ncbi:MAG TPA: hypothetical protein ENI23_06430 [bacterium]|nr:hypothetical protein [bacterium]
MRKRIFSLLLVTLLVCGVAFGQSGISRDPGVGEILGQRGYQDEGNKIFRMVRYIQVTIGDTVLPADSIVVWDTTADDGVTVTTTTTSDDSTVAGIIVQQALTQDTNGNTAVQDRGKDNWTWLQTYGKSQVDLVGTSFVPAAGNAMGTSTTKGEADSFLGSITDPTLMGKAGFFYDADTAGDNNVEVFLTGLD